MTTSHLSNVMDQFIKEELVIKDKKGREIEIKITEKGKQLIEILLAYEKLERKSLAELNKQVKNEKL